MKMINNNIKLKKESILITKKIFDDLKFYTKGLLSELSTNHNLNAILKSDKDSLIIEIPKYYKNKTETLLLIIKISNDIIYYNIIELNKYPLNEVHISIKHNVINISILSDNNDTLSFYETREILKLIIPYFLYEMIDEYL